MKIYNTLTRKKEEFKTIEDGRVKMYVCGPTVYNYIHVGNARPLVFFDTVRRYLEYKKYQVDFVMNLTDIDDKIINRSIEENVDYREISSKYSKEFLKNARDLNVDVDAIIKVKATDHIDHMIKFISGLEAKDAAYDSQSSVYFDVSKAKNYGKLSHRNLDDLEHGSRVEISEDKKHPNDFALWKKQKNVNEPGWDSPWGRGRPGWHIECSTMAKETLGETIDIHGGGEDLQFPHHENEIAQSETLHDKTFANYWMHNSMITVDKEKMSKSLGNFFTIHDIENEYDLMIVRIWLISSHYRSPLDFSRESLDSIKSGYQRLQNTYENLERLSNSVDQGPKNMDLAEKISDLTNDFIKSMDDDFNTANALSTLFEFSKYININYNEKSSNMDIDHVKLQFTILLDVLGIKFYKEILDNQIEDLIEERSQARKDRNFKRADEIRDILKEQGIELKDTPTGVVWTRS